MAVSAADGLILARLALRANAALDAAVDGRVFGPHLIEADAGSLERPCVIVDLLSGGAEYHSGSEALTAYIYAYDDRSQGNAMEIYDLIYAALQGTRLIDSESNVTAAGYAQEVSRPITGYNDQVRAHFARGVWTLRLAG